MEDAQLELLARLPPAQSCRRIDFEDAHIVTLESFPPQYVLAVSGTAPVFNLRVDLVPLAYVRQPEYWGIEVVGCLPGQIFLPAERPFSVTLGLAGVTGTKGVEVIGASRTLKLDVPPNEGPVGAFSLSINYQRSGVVRSAWLTCSPDGGTHPQAAVACRQLAEVNGHVEAIPPDPGPCTDEHDPVLLQASGTWNGEARRFAQVFGNPCEGRRGTGGVLFVFDDRMRS